MPPFAAPLRRVADLGARAQYLLAFTFQPVAHVLHNGAAGGGSFAPSISAEALATLGPGAVRMVRLLPRL